MLCHHIIGPHSGLIKHSRVGRGQVPYLSLKLTGGSVALRFTSLSLRMVPMSVRGRIGVP